MIPPEAKRQIDLARQDLLRALIAAFSAKHDSGLKVVVRKIYPSEFDHESRWWVEPEEEEDRMQYSQGDVDRYYLLTNIPPEKAMISLTVDGDKVSLCFMPKVQVPTTNSKPKGFSK